jgi:hypothetical protein
MDVPRHIYFIVVLTSVIAEFLKLGDRFIPGSSFPHYLSFITDPVSILINIKTKL